MLRDAADLLKTAPTPVRYVIPGWLSEGLTLIAAPPKLGKSTLVLQAAFAVASGGEFWGAPVPKSKVLLIDLETNERRLRRKLASLGGMLEAGQLVYSDNWPRGTAGVAAIAQTLLDNPEIRMVVIDTLQRFREPSVRGVNVYASDYEALAPLQQLCRDRSGLAIVAIHHTRKAAAVVNPIDSINGSAAIAGAADAIWILSRKGSQFVLHVEARDWEREVEDFALVRQDGGWSLSETPRHSQPQQQVIAVLERLGPSATQTIAKELGVSRQAALLRLQRMMQAGLIVVDKLLWRLPS